MVLGGMGLGRAWAWVCWVCWTCSWEAVEAAEAVVEDVEDVEAEDLFTPNGDDVDCRRWRTVGGLGERICGEAGA